MWFPLRCHHRQKEKRRKAGTEPRRDPGRQLSHTRLTRPEVFDHTADFTFKITLVLSCEVLSAEPRVEAESD